MASTNPCNEFQRLRDLPFSDDLLTDWQALFDTSTASQYSMKSVDDFIERSNTN